MNVFPSVKPDQPVMSLNFVIPEIEQLVQFELSNEHIGLVVSVSVKDINALPLTAVAVTGVVIETTGAMVSTVMWMVEDVVVLPAESVALDTKWWAPCESVAE